MAFFALRLLCACVVLSGASAAAWDRPNDKDLSDVTAQSYGCGTACVQSITRGIDLDRTTIWGAIPFDEDFYTTAANFSTSEPGDVLKVQAYIHAANSSSWSIPGGTTLFRIQYVSVGANDKPVPSTAFVAFPLTFPTNGCPFQMVALAHGTIGTHYGCAPATSFNLYDYDTWRPILLSGYAVVATDYAGLGNNYTKHYWQANTLNANDVYYSAVAAKRAFRHWLSDEWVAIGHSQGGGTAWAVGESELTVRNSPLKFLGAAALEPGVRFADEVIYSLNASTSGAGNGSSAALAGYSSYVYAAINAFDPSLIADIFTPEMIERQQLGDALGVCFYGEAALVADLFLGEGVASVVKNATALALALERYQAATGAGIGATAKAPMLVVQSTADLTVPYPIVETAWETICAAGGYPVQFSVYPDVDHGASLGASAPEWLKWIADRFAGVPGPRSCERVDHYAVDVSAAYLPLDF